MIELESRSLLSGYIVNDSGNAPLDPAVGPAETSSGTITLLSAIEQVNLDGSGFIGFQGPMTIKPNAAYPAITAANVSIAASTPGTVMIDGTGNWAGLIVQGGHDTLQNLVIDGSSGDGIDIESSDNALLGNRIGTNAAGTAAVGNTYWGVIVYEGSNNTIGGTSAGAPNLISGNGGGGIGVRGIHSTGDVIEGNLVGVDLSGADALGNGYSGIYVGDWGVSGDAASYTTIIDNVVSDNGNWGVWLTGPGTTHIVVQDNRIGTNAAGTVAISNSYDGVYVDNVTDSTIGGTTPASGNLISGNSDQGGYSSGIVLVDPDTSGNLVQGNLIGTSANGNQAIGNSYAAVSIENGANANTVGGTTIGAQNVLSGSIWGAVIFGAGTSGNLIEGNFVGTNQSGSAALPNEVGIGIYTAGNTIGGNTPGAGNLISGNTYQGISLNANATLIQGNDIGTTESANAAIPNGSDGLDVTGNNNTIGGTISGAGNVLSGNAGDGIQLVSANKTLVQGNLIGTNAAGSAAIPNNGLAGVMIYDSDTNTIGGTTAGTRNVISGNSGNGIQLNPFYGISGEQAQNNLIEGNYIGADASGGLPLGNGGDGIFTYFADSNTIGGAALGTANLFVANKFFGLEFYASANNVIAGNFVGITANSTAAGNGDGGISLENASDNNTVGGTTAGAGNVVSANAHSGIALSGSSNNAVSGNMVGTNPNGIAAMANAAQGILIQNGSAGNTIGGATPGSGNLISGNLNIGLEIYGQGTSGNSVQGNIVGLTADGTQRLGNATQGIEIGGGASYNTIGGTTSSTANQIASNGNIPNSTAWEVGSANVDIQDQGTSNNLVEGNFIGTNAQSSSGLSPYAAGIYIGNGATNDTIGGTTTGARNIISGSVGDNILIDQYSGDQLIEGNIIGLNAAGSAELSGLFIGSGITINGFNNTIGGTSLVSGNIISGNAAYGIELVGTTAIGNLIEGNKIGTDITGAIAIRNLIGLGIFGANDTTIGGTTPGACNVISGNFDGTIIALTTDTLVEGNDIGTNELGSNTLGNSESGISIEQASGVTIGGTTPAAANVIAYNGENGIIVGTGSTDASIDNAILGNSIAFNTGLGIDINNASPQPAPSVTSAISTTSQTTITGTVTGAPNETFRVEFFSNSTGTNQGQSYLGFLNVTTNSSGSASFSFTPTSVIAPGLAITATATDPNGNTSAFSTATTVLSNVTNDLAVKLGSFVYNRSTRQFTQTITITNISGSAIVGPIELVLLNLKNGSLTNESGTLLGNPYITISNPGSLGVGQSLTITLVFADPTLATISFLPEFLIGPIPTTES
jgi:parallel beta-helix repeat protein